jgi:antitoxin FitA
MSIIQIRDVPDDVQAELARRAAAASQSLTQYVRELLVTEVSKPDIASIWDKAAKRARLAGSEYSFEDVTSDVREFRERGRPE